MIDLHCHILPGLDDGAFSLDESLMMAEAAYESGTRGIVCTSHSGPYPKDELLAAFSELQHALRRFSIPIEIYTGQEIYLTEHFPMQIRDIERGYPITINNTAYILVEFDPMSHSRILKDAVDRLTAGGFIPIIAHPERYRAVAEDVFLAQRLKAAGALLQLNKGSLKGAFGPDAMRAALYMLDERMADFIASDAHSPYERTPKLREVHAFVSEQYSIDYADLLLRENPARVVGNIQIGA